VLSPSEPLMPSHDQPMFAGAFCTVLLRILLFLAIASAPVLTEAVAGPLLGDDVATCRERQHDAQVRLDACERLIASGQAAPKDLAAALDVRGEGLGQKRDYDKAIAAFSAAIAADPENFRIINNRGVAYEHKGQDDLAMADYELALQKRPNYAFAYNNRGTLFLRKGALQSALDDFNAALKYAPTMYLGHANRGRVLALNKEFDAAQHGETALDGEGADSPFALALARDLKEPHVEVRKLFDIVRDDVWTATRHAQQPFTYGSPSGREDFYFVAGK
jgi:tetratricopeptide (TPR) repeat protein